MDRVRLILLIYLLKIFFLFDAFRENMGDETNPERAQQMFDKSIKIEQQFGDLLTGNSISNDFFFIIFMFFFFIQLLSKKKHWLTFMIVSAM